MRKILTFIIMTISFSAYSLDNAGIYLKKDISISKELIEKYAPGSKVISNKSDNGVQYIVTWPDVTVTINTINKWPDRDVQLQGMYNWISSIQTGNDDTKDLLNTIPQLTNLAGCTIEPSYDVSGKAANLVKSIALDHSGLIFSFQSFYSAKGKWLAGNPADSKQI